MRTTPLPALPDLNNRLLAQLELNERALVDLIQGKALPHNHRQSRRDFVIWQYWRNNVADLAY